jgi:glycosyltransferase involved in cell wall biosynthesis
MGTHILELPELDAGLSQGGSRRLSRKQPMRIAMVNMPIEFYSPVSGGAISTIIMNSARELMARGCSVDVFTPVNDDPMYSVGEVHQLRVPRRRELHFFKRRMSALRCRTRRFDWPYFDYFLRSLKRTIKRLSPAPHAVVMFNDLISPSYVKRWLPQSLVAVWLQNECRTRFSVTRSDRCTDVYLACSDYVRRWTARTHRIALNKIRVVPSGVNRNQFRPRHDYLADAKPLRVLFVGRIDRNKGPDIAADAVAALQREGVDVSFTVAGGLWFYGHGGEAKDPFFQLLQEKISAVGGVYHGHVNRHDLPEIYRQHDVVCVLSRSNEPFGLVVLEAMASGCAVIASNRGGLPEACGGAAMLRDPEDLHAVTAALRSVALSPEALRHRKKKSVERAATADWNASVDALQLALAGAGVKIGLTL